MSKFDFINENIIKNAKYEYYPFPHVVIDNFFNEDKLNDILYHINNLKDENSSMIFKNNEYEFNKYTFENNYGEYLKKIFKELNSIEFITFLENLSGIKELIKEDITLLGAGIHRIKNQGHLQLHTDFNSYFNNNLKLDRRINLLIYMNPFWRDEYNGHLYLCNKEMLASETNLKNSKIISPILNRCVIFNTTSDSIHGHPFKLLVPEHIYRQSIAVYYYTNNINGKYDFEGDEMHSTIWYSKSVN